MKNTGGMSKATRWPKEPVELLIKMLEHKKIRVQQKAALEILDRSGDIDWEEEEDNILLWEHEAEVAQAMNDEYKKKKEEADEGND